MPMYQNMQAQIPMQQAPQNMVMPQMPNPPQQPATHTTYQAGKPIYSNYQQPNPLDHFKKVNYAQGSLMSQLMKEQVENQNKPESKASQNKP